nr:hypothetical protein [Tanacetum cinerariifolium]
MNQEEIHQVTARDEKWVPTKEESRSVPPMENVDYLELIWEDLAFQIDHRQLKKGGHRNMPYPRHLEEEMARDAQRMNEQIIRDAEIARIHAEEELQIMIDGLDRNNETVAKYLQEYHQFAAEWHIGRRIELISVLVKYQDNYAKVLKYQTQQRKPLSKKKQREFYMSVLKSHSGWKAKHFKGMILEEIKEKFDPVWKQIQDFVPLGSKEEEEKGSGRFELAMGVSERNPQHQTSYNDEFLLPKEVPTASEESSPCCDKEKPLLTKIALLKKTWGETLYEYYWRFSQLINDMHTIRMTMQQVQVNTKFLNALPPEWKSIIRDRYPDPHALVANSQTIYNPSHLPPDVYAFVNHQEAAKAIWDKVKALEDCKSVGYLSTNEVNTGCGVSNANTQASPASTQVNTTSTQVSTANLRLFSPPKLDLSNSGLEEFQQPEFEGYGSNTSKSVSEDIFNEVKEYRDAPLVKDRVSDNKDCSVESPVVVEKKTVVPTVTKVKFVRPKQQKRPVRN